MDKTLQEILKSNKQFDFEENLIFLGTVGSAAHGTYVGENTQFDDLDLAGVVIPPPSFQLGLSKFEQWVEARVIDNVTYDWQIYNFNKFCTLLLGSNPNIITDLYLPVEMYHHAHPVFLEVVKYRHKFSNARAKTAFLGYASSQIKRMDRLFDPENCSGKSKVAIEKYGWLPKMGAHAIRLLWMGIEFVSTGELTVWQPNSRANLIKDIKRGEWSLASTKEYCEQLYRKLEETKCVLPEKSDFDFCNRLVANLTLEFWKEKGYV